MVQKIKLVVFILILFVFCLIGFNLKGRVEFNLVKTLLPQNINNSNDIILALNLSSSRIKVIFESDSEDNLENLKDDFIEELDKEYFNIVQFDTSGLVNKYLTSPNNFLSDKTKKLLINKKYDEIYFNSINMLYNPTGFLISPLDKDPYLLLDDFILNGFKLTNKKENILDKFYDCIILKINNNEGLSPDLSNKKIHKLIKLKNKLSDNSKKIYLAGSPVHSYYTSIKSIVSINIICLFSTFLIIFLTYFYFRSLKLLIPIALSIISGLISGYVATKFWFSDFQIITMVFSTTLIGIGIDYSYHYFFADENNKNFIKNLTFSYITTAVSFALLYLSGIELLKQVSVFMIFGLFGIYIAVLFIYPCFKVQGAKKNIEINQKSCLFALIFICVLSLFGLLRFHFNDSLASLYTPSKNLKQAEALYNQISSDDFEKAKLIVVKGSSFNEVIKNEENIADSLFKNDIDYISISKIIPSIKVQKENFELVKELYKNNLDKFLEYLSKKQINALKNSKFSPVHFEFKDYPYLSDFMLNENSSLMFVFSNKDISKIKKSLNIIDFKGDIEACIKNYRIILLKIFPLMILTLFVLLMVLYDFKKALKMLIPPFLGAIFAIFFVSLIFGEISLFSIIAMFLTVGFTLDYSIFRASSKHNTKTENAIFASCLTTSFSFLLLSFCSFKLLSSIAVIIFVGIIVSYLSGKIIFLNKNN